LGLMGWLDMADLCNRFSVWFGLKRRHA